MIYTKEAIYDYLCEIMEELFEIEKDDVKPDAQLFEDLDIDSIDAVDMVVKLKQFTGSKISPADFKDVRTVQDIVDAVFKVLSEKAAAEGAAGN